MESIILILIGLVIGLISRNQQNPPPVYTYPHSYQESGLNSFILILILSAASFFLLYEAFFR